MTETNLYISNTGDDGLTMHCFQTTCNNFGVASNIVEEQIGTYGAKTGGNAISIDGGFGVTVSGLNANTIGTNCVHVYADGYTTNVPDAIILNDIGCTSTGSIVGSGGAAGFFVDKGLHVHINNPNINTTSSANGNPASGIRVDDPSAQVWVNGGILRNLGNEGVRVDTAALFHMVGTEISGAQDQGITVSGTADLRLSNILVRDSVLAKKSNNRAVDLEGLTGSLDVHNITIQDDRSPALGCEFFTYNLDSAQGIIAGVSGYIPHGSLVFNFQLASGASETRVIRRHLYGSSQPTCNSATEGLEWYTPRSSSMNGSYAICQNNSGSYTWPPH